MKQFLLALLIGALSAFAFAPVGLWPLMQVALAALCELIWRSKSLKQSLAIGWGFGLGQFVAGLNWIATAFTYQDAMPAWLQVCVKLPNKALAVGAANCASRLMACTRIGLGSVATVGRWEAARRYLPSLLRSSVVTIVLSCLSMALAVSIGVVIATGRVYGGPILRTALTAYVELIRGTPILLQLFVLYYGLASAIRLPAFVAALLGLALNYAAYESEIYRSALEAISTGQLEAARTLGLSERQVLTLVRAPQAFRLALAPMTNDFIALLKDSSLVSVLTVLELTKQTQIFATNLGSWVIPGTLCAALYLAMSLPLAALARRMEQQWRVTPQ